MRYIALLLTAATIVCLGTPTGLRSATFAVTDTTDSGPGSLRNAITLANAFPPGADTISFNIPYAGVQKIALSSQLPALTDTAGVFIDGFSQPGAGAGKEPPRTATIMIEVDGATAGPAFGFLITSPNNTIQGLSVGKFSQSAIRIQGAPYPVRDNFIYCNFIGTDASGLMPRANGWDGLAPWAGVEIVAPTPSDYVRNNTVRANLVSNTQTEGVYIGGNVRAFWNFVTANYIGTDINGMSNHGNSRCGIVLDDGAYLNTIDSNLICFNGTDGVAMLGNSVPTPPHSTSNNYIHDNIIGLARDMATAAPNGMSGINVGGYSNLFFEGYASNNSIGPNNIIAHNAWEGIRMGESIRDTTNADGNRIWQNSIYNNGRLGIDLAVDGVDVLDPGDPDNGPNQQLNYPVITHAYEEGGGQVMVVGWVFIDSNPRSAVVEVFKAMLDSTGYGEGALYLGSANPDQNGDWWVRVTGVSAGDSLTATTTDNAANTSEFALCAEVMDSTASVNTWAGEKAGSLAVEGPNPAVTDVTVSYTVSVPTRVRLCVYDVRGRLVDVLVETDQHRGQHSATWARRDGMGRQVAEGLYFIRLETPAGTAVTKVLVSR